MKAKILLILLIGCMSPVFSAQPIFNLEPSVKASKIIYEGQTGIAYYKITNHTPLALYDIGVHNLPAGVSQDPVGAGLLDGLITCRTTFDLEPSASCLLKLNIVADQIIRPIKSGPKVCQAASALNPIYCSTPADVSHILKVTKQNLIPSTAPELTITPSSLALVTGGLQTVTVTNTSSSVTVNNIVADFSDTALANKIVTVSPNPGGGNACTSVAPGASCILSFVSYSQAPLIPSTLFTIKGANSQPVEASASVAYAAPNLIYKTLLTSPLVNADVWDNTPKIMSANYGFEGIIAVPNGESSVVNAGGAWNIISTPGAAYAAYTSAADIATVTSTYGYPVYYDDAMPICFSQPILTSTINPTVFELTLNTGEKVTPHVASLTPNFFYNESSCAVIFGAFGNRIPPGEPGAVYPTEVSIIEGSSNGTAINLTLVGPGNVLTNMTGASIASRNPYLPGGGPSLLAAKLSVMSAVGQNTQPAFAANVPNDGIAYYGAVDAQYRLRMYTTAGFALGNFKPSPTRPMSLMPSDYSNFFRIQVGPDSNPIYLENTGVTYTIPGAGTIEVVGLASLGLAGTPENDAYVADNNNYIDVVLKGDETAMRQITYLDIPAAGTNPATGTPYLKLYNPGGPGNNPTPGVFYTQPGPPVHMAVTQAIDDPNTVTYP
ncbi:MAG: hypothetical protein P1U36_05520 [Legionellaceae bacterium]|nr:hypothetical protein [Legionellaceae bacterium]